MTIQPVPHLASALDALPLFASDKAIAEAIVGKKDADKWIKERLPAIEKIPGFPKVDVFHGGRAVPLVKRFYAEYLSLPKSGTGAPDGEENENAWKKPKRRGSSGSSAHPA